jgi:membrane-bound inhibitor of C-type lysozyme
MIGARGNQLTGSIIMRFFRTAALALLVTGLPVVASAQVVGEATFECSGGKSIKATFYSDKVDLVLSDGRSMTVPQAMSASGARYANADETFVFWNKGNTAFITEGANGAETYSDCVTK